MTKLRKLAEGQSCQVRIPYVPCSSQETVVLCHVRRAGTAGIGQKPPDLCGIYACSAHHDIVDGRKMLANLTKLEIDQAIFFALLRTLVIVSKELKV